MKPIPFKSFSGQECTAQFLTEAGLPSLCIRDAQTKRVLKHVVMSQNEAESFFLNINREASQ